MQPGDRHWSMEGHTWAWRTQWMTGGMLDKVELKALQSMESVFCDTAEARMER